MEVLLTHHCRAPDMLQGLSSTAWMSNEVDLKIFSTPATEIQYTSFAHNFSGR